MGSRFVGRSGASMWASRLARAGAAPGGLFRQGRYRRCFTGGALRDVRPYADPTPSHNFRTCLTRAKWASVCLANSLELGCDCWGRSTTLMRRSTMRGSADRADECHVPAEEDASILWKHLEYQEDGSTRAEVAGRAAWSFLHLDGGQLRVRLLLVPLPGWDDPVRDQIGGIIARLRFLRERSRFQGRSFHLDSMGPTTSTTSMCGSI